MVTPNHFLGGTRCPKCFKSHKKTTKQFIDEVRQIDADYVVVGEYQNNRKHILMRHTKCNKEFLVTPGMFLFKSSRCPYCNESKCEKVIENILREHDILFERQKSFDDLVDIRKLRFGFFIPEFNLLIEYDGEGHFKKINRSSDDLKNIKALETTILHDKMKNEYCIKNHINLLRINHFNKNDISSIINSLIKFCKENQKNFEYTTFNKFKSTLNLREV